MNATGLPIPVATTAPTQAAGESLTPATQTDAQGPTDFVLALAQMVGKSVPTTDTQAQLAATSASLDDDLETDLDAAALALLALPLAQMAPNARLEAAGAVSADPLEMLGLTANPNASARDAALLQALTERLAGAVEEPTPDAQLPSGALGSLDTIQRPAAAESAAHTRSLQHPVGTQAWADELGSRLTMMTDKGQHTASLRLSPEHLGPLEVRIAMREDQASVWFGAAHADTRAAIEHALPRLRELFAAQGMSLADAGVFREPPKQQLAQWQANGNSGDARASTEIESVAARVQIGLLDAYA